MKRILAMLLTVAMLATACPMVFADEVTEESNIAATENLSAEAPEAEENIEESPEDPTAENAAEDEATVQEGNISLFAAANDISLMSADEVQYSTDGSTWTGSTLAAAVTAIGTGTGTIKVTQDITLTTTLNITGNITMVSDGADVTITRASTLTDSPMVEVKSGATLALGTETPMSNTLTFDGGAIWSGDGYPLLSNNTVSNNSGISSQQPIIDSAGTLSMYEKIILQNNYTLSKDVFTPVGGGALKTSGAFNMYGGEIINNYAEAGGGVIVCGSSQSEMNLAGGKIMNNAAELGGAVYLGENPGKSSTSQVGHKLAMSGGIISGNSTGENSLFTGTVCVMYNSEFTMTGGEITGNKSVFGGGVGNYGKLNVTDGYIHDNTASGTSLSYELGGDDVWNYGEGASTGNSLSLPTKLVHGDASYTIKWYYDGCKNGDFFSRYALETASEKTTLTDNTEQCSLKAVYTEILPEAEYSYECRTYGDPNYGKTITGKGTFKDAVTAIKNNGNNPGTITLLKDVVIDETIAITNVWTIKSKDGETHTITRALEFTGPIISITQSSPTIGSELGTLVLNGGNIEGMKPLIKITGAGADPIKLLNIELKNNKAENGGAINTTSATIKATNVNIKNCSAVNGGALYWDIGNQNSKNITLNNCTFIENSADAGSAIYIKNDNDKWNTLELNGCTFESNGFVNAESNADKYIKSTTIYFDNAATSANQYSLLNISGETKFDNTTNSDIMLDHGLATSTSYANLQVISGFANIGKPIKVAVGAFSRNSKTGTYVINDNRATSNVFSLVGTYENPVTGNYILGREGSYYLAIKEPAKVFMSFYSTSGGISSADTVGAFNEKTNGAVTLSVTPNFEETEKPYSGKMVNQAVENIEYTLTATANNAKITSLCIQYNSGLNKITVDGTVADDKVTAMLKLTPELLSAIVSGNPGSAIGNIYIEYELTKQAITTSATHGTISDITSPAPIGSEVTFTLTPEYDTYELGSYKVFKTGEEITDVDVTDNGDGTYTFTMPEYPVTVSAEFVKKKFNINANPVENGGITVTETPVTWGETVTFSVDPNAYYEIDSVTVDNGAITPVYDSASGLYSFTMPTYDVTVSATFKKVKYTITSEGSNVTFDIPDTDTFDWGDTVTIKATPDEWYNITSVTAPGVEITDNGDGTYSFIMPTANITVTAIAERPNFNITFDSKGGSAVTSQVVSNGNAVSKPVVPQKTNYGFAGWYTDEAYTNKYDFTQPVIGDLTLYARWFLWGDVNGDGKANSTDALLINRCYVKIIDYSDLAVPMAARVSGADKTRPNSTDALLINRKYVKLIDTYPVEASASGYEFDLENNTYYAPNELGE